MPFWLWILGIAAVSGVVGWAVNRFVVESLEMLADSQTWVE